MKRLVLSLFAYSTAFSSPVYANELDGFFGGAGISFNNAKMDIKLSDNETLKLSNDGNTVGLSISLGYGTSFDQFYIGGDFSYRTTGGKSKETVLGNTTKTESKNLKTISITPGYYIAPETLFFGRLGTSNVVVSGETTGMSSITENANGTVVGLGFKHKINNNMAGVLEYQHLTGEKTADSRTYKLTATSFNFGLQYSF